MSSISIIEDECKRLFEIQEQHQRRLEKIALFSDIEYDSDSKHSED